MLSRKDILDILFKRFPIFHHEKRTRTPIKNLRHRSLHTYVNYTCHLNFIGLRRDILVQKTFILSKKKDMDITTSIIVLFVPMDRQYDFFPYGGL